MTAEGCEALSFRGKDSDEDEDDDEVTMTMLLVDRLANISDSNIPVSVLQLPSEHEIVPNS